MSALEKMVEKTAQFVEIPGVVGMIDGQKWIVSSHRIGWSRIETGGPKK